MNTITIMIIIIITITRESAIKEMYFNKLIVILYFNNTKEIYYSIIELFYFNILILYICKTSTSKDMIHCCGK